MDLKQRQKDEPAFVTSMRKAIYEKTGYEVVPSDPIYPIICCMQIMAEGIFKRARKQDLESIEEFIRRTEAKINKREDLTVKRFAKFIIFAYLAGIITGVVLIFLGKIIL